MGLKREDYLPSLNQYLRAPNLLRRVHDDMWQSRGAIIICTGSEKASETELDGLKISVPASSRRV